MIKKILFIIVGLLVLAALIALLWLWISPKQQTPSSGTFGTAGDRPGSGAGGTGSGTNLGSTIPGANTGTPAGGGTVSGGSGTQNTVSPGGATGSGVGIGAGGGLWVGGGAGGSLSGSGRVFTPSEITQLGSANGGLPTLSSNISGSGTNNDLGLLGLLGAGAGCALYPLFQAKGLGEAEAQGALALARGYVLVYDTNVYGKQSGERFTSVADCLARTAAKAAIQQMTASIVNWINSGFNGQPAFVTNFEQFFSNVGDQAAGEFIRGSGLAFLCSPFQLQVRIAIAQAYANRNAQSCSLTSVVRNVNSFMNGNFSQGGWGGFLTFTTMPVNNPYGAYAYAQIGLANSQTRAIQNAQNNLSPGGFISVQKCNPPDSRRPQDCKVVTPGGIVENTLTTTLEQPFLAQQLAKSFDEIISALYSQLITRTLYQGITSYGSELDSSTQGAINQAQGLLNEMQAAVQLAQQYGSVSQGAIRDIQQVQQNYNEVYNCWKPKNETNAAAAQTQIDSLEARVKLYNAEITRANTAIARIQDFQTQLTLAKNASEVSAVQSSFNAAKASGAFITQTEVTTALQDRQTLQAQMQTLNSQASTQLTQCRAS